MGEQATLNVLYYFCYLVELECKGYLRSRDMFALMKDENYIDRGKRTLSHRHTTKNG